MATVKQKFVAALAGSSLLAAVAWAQPSNPVNPQPGQNGAAPPDAPPAVRYYQEKDIARVERFIRGQRTKEFFLIGGMVWPGLEAILTERLRAGVKVRIVTTEVEAARLGTMIRAGAEVRTGPGKVSLGKIMVWNDYIMMKKSDAYFFVQGNAVTLPVKGQLEAVWRYGHPFGVQSR